MNCPCGTYYLTSLNPNKSPNTDDLAELLDLLFLRGARAPILYILLLEKSLNHTSYKKTGPFLNSTPALKRPLMLLEVKKINSIESSI